MKIRVAWREQVTGRCEILVKYRSELWAHWVAVTTKQPKVWMGGYCVCGGNKTNKWSD